MCFVCGKQTPNKQQGDDKKTPSRISLLPDNNVKLQQGNDDENEEAAMKEQMALAELERLSTMVEQDMRELETNDAEDEVDMFNFEFGEENGDEEEDGEDGEVNCLDELCLPE